MRMSGAGEARTQRIPRSRSSMIASALLFALALLSFTQSARPQTKIPGNLLQIMHCMEADKLVAVDAWTAQHQAFRVSWTHSLSRDPAIGEEFYVIIYHSSTTGDILVYQREQSPKKVDWYIVNNASFTEAAGNFRYTNDPLGGVWTQNHVRDNVNQALRKKQYLIPYQALAGKYKNVSCHFYPASK